MGDLYFDSYCDLEVHKLMLEDRARTQAYKDAIEQNADLIRGKTVMDVGAGTGILSLMCAGVGATKVYAVEASNMAKHVEEVVKANNMQDIIEVKHCRVEDLTLPHKVDVIVSEWMGFYLLHESMLDSVLIARDAHLSESGFLMPSHADLYVAACDASELRRSLTQFWTQDLYGFDLSPLAKVAAMSGKPEVTVLETNQVLTKPQTLITLDLRYTSIDDVRRVQGRHFCSIEAADHMDDNEVKAVEEGDQKVAWNAIALWFDVHFRRPNAMSTEPSTTLSTAPSACSTHWKQSLVFVSDACIELEEGDVIGWDIALSQSEENHRHYKIEVQLLDAGSEEHPVPCHCQWAKCVLIQKLLQYDDDDDEEEWDNPTSIPNSLPSLSSV